MADVLAAMLAALDEKPLRGPDANNPMKPIQSRPERRSQRAAHRDPTGNQAIGNIRRQEKKR